MGIIHTIFQTIYGLRKVQGAIQSTYQIHAFAHDRIGRFELFIVPIGRQPGIIEYLAVFNRLVKS